jgi:lipopolysaccharide transport system ATP-binding protein
MSETIIKVENLGKKYIIGHQATGGYKTFREQIFHHIHNFYSRTKQMVTGGEVLEGEETEEFWALKDVNFEVKQGDRLGIIGRNGAGKSTLLKILSRITEPTSGRVKIKGRVASLLEVGTGFHQELTGRENIFLNGAILGMSRIEIKRKFDEIVDFSGVEKFLDTPVKRYSSGMYVRLAFSVAAHLEPEILLVDEVLAVGDEEFQKKCLGKMKDVSTDEGRTVLFVSHNMGIIAQLCNKALLLNKGMLEISGETNTVVDQYINHAINSPDTIYEIEEKAKSIRSNYFTRIYTSKANGEFSSDFSFDENIVLNFEFIINDYLDNLLIGIGLHDKYHKRVTTFLRNVSQFKKNGNVYQGKLIVPSDIIAPNVYTFLCAIWVKGGTVYDKIESICQVKIHDNGTEFAVHEGDDYGNMILKANWQ